VNGDGNVEKGSNFPGTEKDVLERSMPAKWHSIYGGIYFIFP